MDVERPTKRRGRRLRQDLAALRRLAGQRAARIADLLAERDRLLDRLGTLECHFVAWEAEMAADRPPAQPG